ncbi:MAG: GTPase HflX, partial [Deltaproteobacteria bacterium]|nr:GTPase HflX [Deltaproteobacteria bacterium]
MHETERQGPERAVLVSVLLPGVTADEQATDLAELGRLVETLGYQIAATVTQAREALAPAAVLGEGKLRALAALTGGTGKVAPVIPGRRTRARRDGGGDDDDESPPDAELLAAEALLPLEGERPTLVAVDHDLSPSQVRNLERATGVRVLDRAGVIIEIFHRHARSREARLQVELARLRYVAPRLRESGQSERQAGRGAGDSALELDRRRIRDRI